MKIYSLHRKICFLLLCSLCATWALCTPDSFAAREQPIGTRPVVTSAHGTVVVSPTPSTVLAPQGLTETEQVQLEQQYRYEFRNKSTILSPYIAAAGGGIPGETTTAARTEQEKLYRYFGAALQFYEMKRYDEAIEILKYILDKNPDDGYVRGYLERVEKARTANSKIWTRSVESQAGELKNSKIKNLMRDGIAAYNRKEYDAALLKFSDVLGLEPDNKLAKVYFDKLKEYYLREVRIENLVEKAESGDYQETENNTSGFSEPSDKAANALLDRKEKDIAGSARKLLDEKEGKIPLAANRLLESEEGKTRKAAETMLDEEEMNSVLNSKKGASLLDQTELGLTVEKIIAQKKEEEEKSYLYTLGPGDVILISVRDHPELSGNALVRLNGEIVLPLVNDVVKVEGLTADESAGKIQELLTRYVKDPYVTVTIEEYRSKTFYVIDELGCTPYPITRANLTLRDALFIADWGDNRALGRVLVMRPNAAHPIIKKVDAFDIIYRGNLANNVRIQDGDVIYVPLTVAAKVTKTVADTIRPFAAVRQARDEWINLKGDIKSWKELPRIREDFDKQGYQDMMWGIGNSSIGVSSQ